LRAWFFAGLKFYWRGLQIQPFCASGAHVLKRKLRAGSQKSRIFDGTLPNFELALLEKSESLESVSF